MKIILLYGPGEVAKRNEALKIKKQFATEDISHLDLKQSNIRDLEVQLSSPSLFTVGQRLVVVENTPDNLDLQKLKITDDSLTLLLLAGSPRVDSPLLSAAKKLSVKLIAFEGEKELTAFPFLDALIEQRKQAFLELEKLLSGYGAMYILTMVYYLLRRNFLPSKPGFMQEKVLRQKKKYKNCDFEKFYYFTLKTEFDIKSGNMDEGVGLGILVQKIISWGQH